MRQRGRGGGQRPRRTSTERRRVGVGAGAGAYVAEEDANVAIFGQDVREHGHAAQPVRDCPGSPQPFAILHVPCATPRQMTPGAMGSGGAGYEGRTTPLGTPLYRGDGAPRAVVRLGGLWRSGVCRRRDTACQTSGQPCDHWAGVCCLFFRAMFGARCCETAFPDALLVLAACRWRLWP